MRSSKYIPFLFLVTVFALSLANIGLVSAGYKTDPTGDAGGVAGCDITRVDVLVDYNHPEDDDIVLKMTLAEGMELNLSKSFNWFDFNFYVDTSDVAQTSNPNTSELTSDIYEYRVHVGRKYSNSTKLWSNTTSLIAQRYYYTADGSGKTMGTYYWNPNTASWVGSDPGIDFAIVEGNTISIDVTGAIYREQPIGTGYVVQCVATTAYNLVVMDQCTESGWIDEFDNMCTLPSSTNTPTLPGFGFVLTFSILGILGVGLAIIRIRK